MKHAWVLGLGLWAAGAAVSGAWGQTPSPVVELNQNYPNPFNPATTIPFRLSGEWFFSGHRPKVSLKIFNVLAQLVAVPVVQGTGEPAENVELTCSKPQGCSFTCYWDGNVLNGQPAASGVYIYQLVVDGRRYTKKMIVSRRGV